MLAKVIAIFNVILFPGVVVDTIKLVVKTGSGFSFSVMTAKFFSIDDFVSLVSKL